MHWLVKSVILKFPVVQLLCFALKHRVLCSLEGTECLKVKSRFSKTEPHFDVLESRPDDEELGWSNNDFTFIHVMKEGERVNEDGTLSYPLPLSKSQEKTFAVCQIIEEDLKAGNVEQMAERPRFKGSEWYLPPFVVTH